MAVTTYKASNVFSNVKIWQEPNTDNTFWVSWNFSKSNVDHYEVQWSYYNKKWYYYVETQTTTQKKSSWSPPAQATKVKARITAVAKTHKVNKKDTLYWKISGYKSSSALAVSLLYNKQMANPSVPNVEFVHSGNGYKLVSTVPGYSSGVETKAGEVQGYIKFTVEAKGTPQTGGLASSFL